ncbi:MAG: hypothetical protein K8R87_04770 [Verrucomicrobia bacterium]|nr:hypothetical protein [Verrucomicrobiota bacterium]
MSPDESESVTRVNPLVRWFVVGLPLGLLIMGALSFGVYFQKRHAKEVAVSAPSRYAAMLRKDLNLADYQRYLRIFEQEIGPRTKDKPDNIEAAQSFIESTLGFGNMGYQVVRREIELEGRACVYFDVELKGRNSPSRLHLVTARYDGINPRDIAALLCLANAFTGTQHRDTIRFIAWFGGADSDGKFQLDRYRRWMPESEFSSVSTKELLGPDAAEKDALGKLQADELEIRTLADGSGGQ